MTYTLLGSESAFGRAVFLLSTLLTCSIMTIMILMTIMIMIIYQ